VRTIRISISHINPHTFSPTTTVLYDRGVKFGLNGGRFESVMVSAPPLIAFKYDHNPAEGSEEARLMAILKQPKDWV
jgi:coproporphyrinogen III oxidase